MVAEVKNMLSEDSLNLFRELIQAHSTPMDEKEVAAILTREWERSGLDVTELGKYAIFAESVSDRNDERPTVLICAHMDSPGYTVESIGKDGITLVTLGGASFDGEKEDIILKTDSGKHKITIEKSETDDYVSSDIPEGVKQGDRGCFVPDITVDEEFIIAPFLDNRLGCFILSLLSGDQEFISSSSANIILAATASEEMGGFGATVLARHIQPDFVIVLDATYASEKQGIVLGGGGVFTLSDNSVILSPQERDRLDDLFRKGNVPCQFEVYNYSGTDAKAFPAVGLPAPVWALLVPTENNHHCNEKAALADIVHTLHGVELLAGDLLLK